MRKFLLYGMNGILNTVVSYVVFILLAQVVDYRLAIVVAYSLGAAQSYLLNGAVVFRTNGSFTLFVCVSIFLMLVNIGITWTLVDELRFPKEVAQLPAIGVVYILGYWINSRFVFSRQSGL